MQQLKIHPLPIINLEVPKGCFTYLIDPAKIINVPVYSWYIEGTKERILVDVGCSAQTMIQKGQKAEDVLSPSDALKTVGTSPEEINIVICTHLHVDHIGYGHIYKNARFIVQKDELEAALNPHPIQKLQFRHNSMLKDLNFEIVEGDIQVAEGIRLLLTPGHTAGNQSVVITTEKGDVIISGICSIMENFEPPDEVKVHMPVITSGVHIDARQAFKSLLRIKQEADIVIPLHDPVFAGQNTIP